MYTISEDLIHFIGTWTDAECRRIHQAIVTFEQTLSSSSRSVPPDEPEWIVVQESPAWGSYYFAHRIGTHDSLSAQSAEELASVLERSSQQV